jgi:hypothetical protein
MRRALCLVVLAGLLALPDARPASAVQAEPAAEAALWSAVDALPSAARAVAPPLRLPALSGGVVDLRQLRGRLVLVYFWASW